MLPFRWHPACSVHLVLICYLVLLARPPPCLPQALNGQLLPSGTPDAPLPRVLALLPGLNLPSETALEYR